MVLKVKANVLRDFVVKSTANGLINDCKLTFGDKGLTMSHKDQPGVILIQSFLDKSAFSEYNVITVSVKDTQRFIKSLKTFGENMVNIVAENNMMKIMDENGGFELAMAESVSCVFDKPLNLPHEYKVLVKKSTVENIVERSKIIQSEDVRVLNRNKTLAFQIGKESDLAQTQMISSEEREFSILFDLVYFKTLVENFDPVFDMHIGTAEIPAKFEEKTQTYSIAYYLTPKTVVDEAKPQ